MSSSVTEVHYQPPSCVAYLYSKNSNTHRLHRLSQQKKYAQNCLWMYVCVEIYVYIHSHTHTHTHIHSLTRSCACLYTYIHTARSIYSSFVCMICVCIYSYIHRTYNIYTYAYLLQIIHVLCGHAHACLLSCGEYNFIVKFIGARRATHLYVHTSKPV